MVVVEKLKQYLEKISAEDKEINAFIELNPEAEAQAKEIDEKIASGKAGVLTGKIIGVKSNINVCGLTASCASNVLKDYKATYDAEVIKRIKAEDGLIIGMLNMDEFASGSSGETSAFGVIKNPANLKRVPGGSSSGSAAAVAAGFCDMTLGSDTGGSIRNPASHCGVVGIKPTYSSVSRNGLIDLSMSLDQIGPLAKNVDDAALLLSVIYGKDKGDSISTGEDKINLKNTKEVPKKLKVALLDIDVKDIRIHDLINEKVEAAQNKFGWEVELVKIEHIDLAVSTYYPLVYTEFFSGTRKLDGRRFGKNIDETAGPEVMRRILGGAEITKAEHGGRYYNKALKAKKIIADEFSKVFEKYDCVICPVTPILPWELGGEISVEDGYASDALTIPANLAGICAISVPAGEIDECPVGLQIMCDKFKDEKMVSIARGFE